MRLLLLLLSLLLALLPSIPFADAANLYHTRATPFNVFSYTFQDGQLAEDGLPPALAKTVGGFGGYELQMNTMGGVEWREERAGLKITGPDGGLKALSIGTLNTALSSIGGEWVGPESGYAQFTMEFWLSQPTYPVGESRMIAGFGNWAAGQTFPACAVCTGAGSLCTYGGWSLYSVGGDKIRFSTRIQYKVTDSFDRTACAFMEVTLVPGIVNHVTIRMPPTNTLALDPKGYLVMNSTGTSTRFDYPKMYWTPNSWHYYDVFQANQALKDIYYPVSFGLPTSSASGPMSWTGTLYAATLMGTFLTDEQITQYRGAGPPNSFPVVTVPSEPFLVNLTNTPTPLPMLAMCSDFDDDLTRLVIQQPSVSDGTLFYNGLPDIPVDAAGDFFSFLPNGTTKAENDIITLRIACADQGGVGRTKTVSLRVTLGTPGLNATSVRTPFVYTGASTTVTLQGNDRFGGRVTFFRISSIPDGANLTYTYANGTTVFLDVNSIVPAIAVTPGVGRATVRIVSNPDFLGNGSLSPTPGHLISWRYRSGSGAGVSPEDGIVTTAVRFTHLANPGISTFLQGSSGVSLLVGSDSLGGAIEYVIDQLPTYGTLIDYGTSAPISTGYVIPAAGRKIRFTYPLDAVGDPYDSFSFYVRNPTTRARSLVAEVVVRIQALSANATFTFADRDMAAVLALYTFQDGMRSYPTQPATLRDWTSRNLLGTMRASTTGNLEWQPDSSGARIVSTAGGPVRFVSSGSHLNLWTSRPTELTLELMLRLGATSTVGKSLLFGTASNIVIGIEPFNTACASEGWRFYYNRPTNGSRQVCADIVLQEDGAAKCITLCVDVVDGEFYHCFLRASEGQVELQVGPTRVSYDAISLQVNTARFQSSLVHAMPLHSSSYSATGTVYMVAIYDKALFDDEVMISQKIGIPPPLARFVGPTTQSVVENVPTLLFNGSTVASLCDQPESTVTFGTPSRGSLSFNGTHAIYTTGAFDLTTATVSITCYNAGIDGLPVMVSIFVVQGLAVSQGTSQTVSAYSGIRKSFTLSGTVIHGGDPDTFTIFSLPVNGIIRNATGGVVRVGDSFASASLPLLFDPPLFVPEDHTGMALITLDQFSFGVSKGGVAGVQNGTVTLHIMNPIHASAVSATCLEDTNCTVQLSGFDELSRRSSVMFKFISLPTVGFLSVNGTRIEEPGGLLIGSAIVFTPPANAFGAPLATFQYVAWNESTNVMSSPGVASVTVSSVDDLYVLEVLAPLDTVRSTTPSRASSIPVRLLLEDVDTVDERFDVSLTVQFPHDFTLKNPMLLQDSASGVTRIEGFGIQSRATRFIAPSAIAASILAGPTSLYVPTSAHGTAELTIRVRSITENRLVAVQVLLDPTGSNATDWVPTSEAPTDATSGIITTMDGAGSGGGGSPVSGTLLYALVGTGVVLSLGVIVRLATRTESIE